MKVHELIRKLEKVNRNKQVRIEIWHGDADEEWVIDHEITGINENETDYVLLEKEG